MLASIARRYARALLDLAVDSNADGAFGEQLQALAEVVHGSPELETLLADPAFSREQRQQALEAIAQTLKLAAPIANLARLLVDRERAGDLDQIASIYRDLADERAGRARGAVRAAVQLSSEEIGAIEAALSKAMHKAVTVEARVDPQLLGGAVAQVGSYLFDGSIRGQLRELRRELKRA